jgi:hypothetical protein
LDLKVNAPSGTYDVVAMTNWRSWEETREISFSEKLGLDTGTSYVAFDFWNQHIYGIFNDRMKVDIAPHDTRVFQLHPTSKRPQLIGNSRHISGAYSILSQRWDRVTNTLVGSSQTVPGDSYTLWIYVPDGQIASQVRASAGGNPPVSVKYLQQGNSLSVTFEGQLEPVDWQVSFADQKQ